MQSSMTLITVNRKYPERDVLCRLGQNHTTVDVRARRLDCCTRLLKHAPRALFCTVASSVQKTFGAPNICALIGVSGTRVAELGDPHLTPHERVQCMREHLWMIKKMANEFLRSHAGTSRVTTTTSLFQSLSCAVFVGQALPYPRSCCHS